MSYECLNPFTIYCKILFYIYLHNFFKIANICGIPCMFLNQTSADLNIQNLYQNKIKKIQSIESTKSGMRVKLP